MPIDVTNTLMEKILAHKLSALLLSLTLLCGGGFFAPGYYWCLGDDGHVHVEAVAAGSCSEMPPGGTSDAVAAREYLAGNDCCGACLDLDARHDNLPHRTGHLRHLSSPNGSLPVSLCPFPASADYATVSPYLDRQLSLDTRLRVLRTTVLLI